MYMKDVFGRLAKRSQHLYNRNPQRIVKEAFKFSGERDLKIVELRL